MDMPVVGRGRVLDELARLASEATAGGGALVLVSGEAGIGKTTMLSCLARLAGAAGIPVLAGRAVADEGAPAFWPWLRVLAQGQKLGLSPTLLELGDGPAAQARFVAVERTALALVAAAAPAGLLVTLDDLQWADDATVQLLRHVCAELPGSRLLVAVATRDLARLDAMSGLPMTRTLELAPLTVADIGDYVRSCVGERVDPPWLEYVSRTTGGNPLFVRELVRALAAEDRFAAPVAAVPVPEPLRPLAAARLDTVSDGCRWLLGGCSVLGDEFDATLLAMVVDRDVDVVPGWLSEAVAVGVLVDGPDTPNRLRFAHHPPPPQRRHSHRIKREHARRVVGLAVAVLRLTVDDHPGIRFHRQRAGVQIDRRPAQPAQLPSVKSTTAQRLGWPPIGSGIEKRQGVVGP